MSWAYEVHGTGDPIGHYVKNGVRFSTKAEADAYGADLGFRWMGFSDGCSVETPDPVTHAWVRAYGIEDARPEYNEYVQKCRDNMTPAQPYLDRPAGAGPGTVRQDGETG